MTADVTKESYSKLFYQSVQSDHSVMSDTNEWSILDERTPLLRQNTRDLSGGDDEELESSDKSTPPNSNRNLSTFAGVFSPVALSMFSTVLFLRLGFVIGQAGLLETLLQFALAYFILVLTVLSICAISTNGAVEGGGAYFMISRALGPEFGGSIGLMFYLANVFACGLYISGFVESLVGNFGEGGSIYLTSPLPVDGVGDGKWWKYLYASMVLLFCLVVCLVGGSLFARTSVVILLVVIVCILSVIISTFFVKEKCIYLPSSNTRFMYDSNSTTNRTCFNYTGYKEHTLENNLYPKYGDDYSTGTKMTFAAVFAILFSSVTGIMNGANMSGELKHPGKAIPKGTLLAVTFTFITYIILVMLMSATTSRSLLKNNYGFMQEINWQNWFVIAGIFATTLSAALGNLIGASRILEALAKDDIFWMFLKPAKINHKGNPYIAVIITWFLVQIVLVIGSLNTIAPLVSVFFLLSYSATNLACLALDLASAPNFRPSFKYFSWYTSFVALVGCLVMCFLINAIFASVSVIIMMVLVIALHLRSMSTHWGSISQAIIFHQVRKYLLMLDSRKDHVKFWRPQILLLVSNPRACCTLIDFINDIKKGGLYILGHVKLEDFSKCEYDSLQGDYPNWLALVDHLKVKAFVELTTANSFREGMRHLIRVSGLGAMKPNTICLGFYDSCLPEDLLKQKRGQPRLFGQQPVPDTDNLARSFPELRSLADDKSLSRVEYVHIIRDALKMQKNVCLCRSFHRLNKEDLSSGETKFIDVWPVNVLSPDSASYLDNTCLFLLQLACILHMVPGWKKRTILRVFLCVNAQSTNTSHREKKFRSILNSLRIQAIIKVITWEHVVCLFKQDEACEDDYEAVLGQHVDAPDTYLHGMNELIKLQCENTVVTFCYLPKPSTESGFEDRYLQQLEILTEGLPPTMLVHGIHPVTSTTL